MNVDMKRDILKAQYANATWRNRVAKMPEAQIHSVYARLLDHGNLHTSKSIIR